jgi:pyruvate dehydrogenase E2 component (dihydrolipoamide acetyltransferase)
LGVDLARVNGSGSGGRITREDVIAAVRQANLTGSTLGPRDEVEHDNYGPIEREKLSRIRRTIAANMVNSVQTVPQLTNFDDADITELEQWRKESSADYEKEQIKLTSMAFVMKAVALALKEHRTVNASLDIENEQIIYKQYVNIGVAVDTERGLIVPVVRDVDRLSIKEIAKSLGELAQKARAGQTAIEEMRGASFTISNLGAIGGVYSTPIINPPEVGILLVGRARKLPIVVDGDRIEPRLMMPLSLTYDHRLVDGAAAARFLNEVIDYLESPRRLLLA